MIRDRQTIMGIARQASPEPAGERIARVGAGGGSGSSGALTQYVVVTVGANHLVCRSYIEATGEVGSDDVYVLMPPELRRALWDGKVINGVAYALSSTGRMSTCGASTENQVIVPAYVPASGDWKGTRIWAAPISAVSVDGVSCSLIDMTGGRAWAWDGV